MNEVTQGLNISRNSRNSRNVKLSLFNQVYADYIRHKDINLFLSGLYDLKLSRTEKMAKSAIIFETEPEHKHPTGVFKAAMAGHWLSRKVFGNRVLYFIATKGYMDDYEKEYLPYVIDWLKEAKIISDKGGDSIPFNDDEVRASRTFAGHLARNINYISVRRYIDDNVIPPELISFCKIYKTFDSYNSIFINNTFLGVSLSSANKIRDSFLDLYGWLLRGSGSDKVIGRRDVSIFITPGSIILEVCLLERTHANRRYYSLSIYTSVHNVRSLIAEDEMSIGENGVSEDKNLLMKIAESAAAYCHYLNGEKIQRNAAPELSTLITQPKKIQDYIETQRQLNKENSDKKNKKKKSKK